MNRIGVAVVLQVSPVEVLPASPEQVRSVLRVSGMDEEWIDVVLQPGETGQPTAFWLVRGQIYMDDPTFSEQLVPVDQLGYNDEIGLYDKRDNE